MKRVLYLIVVLLLILEANGQHVTLNEANEFANGWLTKKTNLHEIDRIVPIKSGDITILFNCVLKPSGYLLISGEKSFNPIIGYSFSNKFDQKNLPDPIKYYIKTHEKKIINLHDKKRLVHPDWNSKTFTLKYAKSSCVEPLIQTQWNQGYPYNDYCPNDAPAGCVAIAMAQLMKFYNYPFHGLNENSYFSHYYGTLSADFKNTIYNWDEMTNTTSDLNDEIAKIIYHSGVSVNMYYTPTSSGASSSAVIDAMVNYFGYNKRSEEILLTSQDTTLWEESIVAELNNYHPILYGGSSDLNFGEAHAFIIDGYDEDGLFHINWGWGGYSDGYYNLQNIVWLYRQRGCFNLYPPPLRAAFEVDITYGAPPLNINFTDYSLFKTDTITNWKWDFNNDGIIDSENKNPSYTYNQYDINSVKLIISNSSYSDTLIESDLITVPCPTIPKHVSKTGNDLNGDGSLESPFKTIQHAINLSFLNNDTIIVDNGKYIENIDFKGKNIFLTSNYYFSKNHYDIINTIIDGNKSGSVVNFDNNENQNAQIIGFTIQNGSGDYVHPHWVAGDTKRYLGGGIRCDNSSPTLKFLIIKDNTLTGESIPVGSAIYAAQNSNIYLNNSIILNNRGGISALYLHSSDVRIDSTFIINNSCGGIKFGSQVNSKIERCVIANNERTEYGSPGIGLHYDCYSNGILNNSIVYNNQNNGAAPEWGLISGSSGIFLNHANLRVSNSIIYDNYPDEVVLSSSSTYVPSNFIITHSDIKGGRNSIITNNIGRVDWIEPMKDYRPLFMDVTKCDFRVEETCESIDAGTDIFIYIPDTLLNIPVSQYSGSHPDIGVFELFSEEMVIEKLLKYSLNNIPEITSQPDTVANPTDNYQYHITAQDSNSDQLYFFGSNIPDWLKLTDNGDGTALLSGIPSVNDIGTFNIEILLTDSITDKPVSHNFNIHVSENTSIFYNKPNSNISIYPNPVNEFLYIRNFNSYLISNLKIFNIYGEEVLFNRELRGEIINVHNLTKGIYFLQIYSKEESVIIKFIKQ